jgi:hypothetical protein
MELFLNDWNALAFTRDCLAKQSVAKLIGFSLLKLVPNFCTPLQLKSLTCCYSTGVNLKKYFDPNLLSLFGKLDYFINVINNCPNNMKRSIFEKILSTFTPKKTCEIDPRGHTTSL